MINFNIGHYLAALRLVTQEIHQAGFRIDRDGERALLMEDGRARIAQNLGYVTKVANDLDLPTVHNRVERIMTLMRLNRQVLCSDIANEMNILLEAFEDDVKFLYLYAYPRDKAKMFLSSRSEWGAAITAFPAIEAEVAEASDLFAQGHNTACVFYCMRILEHGLKAFAADVGQTFDTQQWGAIIGAIEGSIKSIRDNGIAGLDKAQKDARLQFLSEAAKDFAYFKDGWRNYVSHGKANYNDADARGVLEHTKTFMNHLGTRLKA